MSQGKGASGADGVRRYVVLLRGVNLGSHKRIAMADLRQLLTDLGYTDVRTLLQSGNAVVTGPAEDEVAAGRRIEAALAERFGLTTACLVLTAADLQRVVAQDPFAALADNGSRYLANFLFDEPAAALRAAHDPVGLDPERVRIGQGVIYQWCPDGILAAPPVGGFVEKRWKVSVTARNWNTVVKLAALVADPG